MLLIMRITAILIFGTCLHASAKWQSQNITLSMHGSSLNQVFKELKKQSGYNFLYALKTPQKSGIADIHVQNEFLKDALNQSLRNGKFILSLAEKEIAIREIKAETLNASANSLPPPTTIKGRVVNNQNNPLEGASILVVGTKIGTTTDSDGRFTLTVPNNENIVLEISSVGFQKKTVTVNSQKELNIILEPDITGLESVVIVGYGTEKKLTLTGSVSSVNSSDLKAITNSDLATGLAGRLPGLRVKQNSSEPGSYSATYDVRGFGDALIVVDGLIMENRDFARLNPQTIENISILKDASAAIYGVKAANGVILVTTKQGKLGKPTVSYLGDFEIQKFTTTPKPMNAFEFAEYSTEWELNNGVAPDKTTYTAEDIQGYKDGTLPGTDWYGLVTRDFSTQQTHNLNISGGSEKIKYFASGGYLDSRGMWKSGDLNYKKYDLRSNVTTKITDHLKMELNLYAMQDEKNEPGSPAFIPGSIGGIYFSLFMQSPVVPVYANDNPQYLSDTYDGQHPLAITTSDISGYTKTQSRTFQGIYSLTYDMPFVNGLTASLKYGYYNLSDFQKSWRAKYSMYKYDKPTDTYLNTAIKNNPANMSGNYNSLQRSTILGQLDYKGSFLDKNNISATLVYEQRDEKNDNMFTKSEFDANVDQFFAGTKNQQVGSSDIYEHLNKSIISRITYNYSLKYLLEFGFNYGGSSLFPKEKRWGFFPYTSVGWRVSEEAFFKNKLQFITNLKVRASWGEIGDDRAADFQFLAGYTYPNGNYVFNSDVIPGLGFRNSINPDITWTVATTKNLGFDLEINRGLINLSFDVFQRNRSGLLATRILSLPGTVGANLPQENLNSDMRRGFELVLGHSKRTGDINYDLSANFTYARGQRTHIERTPDNNSYLNWRNNTVNRWDNIVWGYKVLGQFQTRDEILNSPLQGNLSEGNKRVKPGDYKFQDVNNDGVINGDDKVPIGKGTMPDMNFGLSGSVTYKQFDLNFLFQGAAGFNYVAGNWFDLGLGWLGRGGLNKFFDRWHHENIFDESSPWIPGRFPSAYGSGTGSNFNKDASEVWIEDASYIRLKSLELGYSIKELFGLKNVRFNISGHNFLTWSRLKDVDPERGDQLIYPIAKTFDLGININL
jgi:TonB-linked SusC/RagA family outer membrane protein